MVFIKRIGSKWFVILEREGKTATYCTYNTYGDAKWLLEAINKSIESGRYTEMSFWANLGKTD